MQVGSSVFAAAFILLTQVQLTVFPSESGVSWLTIADQKSQEIISAKLAYERARNGDVVLIDIRRPSEWMETGVGEGAIPLTMHQSASGFLKKLEDLIQNDKSQPIALICAVGGRSAHLVKYLKSAGYSQVMNVSEGMLGNKHGPGWIRSNLPTRKFEESQRP